MQQHRLQHLSGFHTHKLLPFLGRKIPHPRTKLRTRVPQHHIGKTLLFDRKPMRAIGQRKRCHHIGIDAVDFALKRPDLRDPFLRYLMKTVGREMEI